MSQPYIISLVLNNNRCQDTLECLASLAQSTYTNQKVIVLDNRSEGGCNQTIHAMHPDVELLPLAQNLGYAGNNNIGIKMALAQGAEWIWVLNEDTIIAPDCLSRMIAVGESNHRIGIVGPMVYHHDEPAVIQSAGGKLSSYWGSQHLAKNEPDLGQFKQPQEVDWISGCAILIRRSVFEEIGLFDERFFCYWEETEWCLRATKAGWSILHVPDAKLWHKGVQRNYNPKPMVTYYSTRNRLLLLASHHAPFVVWLHAWGEMLRTLASWTIKPKWRSMRGHRNAMWHGMIDFLRRRWGEMPS